MSDDRFDDEEYHSQLQNNVRDETKPALSEGEHGMWSRFIDPVYPTSKYRAYIVEDGQVIMKELPSFYKERNVHDVITANLDYSTLRIVNLLMYISQSLQNYGEAQGQDLTKAANYFSERAVMLSATSKGQNMALLTLMRKSFQESKSLLETKKEDQESQKRSFWDKLKP